MNNEILGITAALVSALAWAAGAVLYKKFGEHMSATGMNLVKGVINLALLAITLLVVGYERIGTDDFLLLGFSGLLGISLGDTFFFKALQKLGAHVLVLLSLLGQVLTVLFAIMFLGEQVSLFMWAGIALVTGGIAVVLLPGMSGTSEATTASGIIYGLLAVFCMSASVIVAKRGISSVSAIEATFIRMLWGTAGLMFWGGVTRQLTSWIQPFRELKTAGNFFLLVCIVSFGGFWLFHVAIKYTDVSIANTLSSTEPLFVLPLAALFLREKIPPAAIIGTVISVCGIILLCTG